MTAPLDIASILSNAGADADAPEGSQAWALAQVAAAVGELVCACYSAVTDEGMDQRELDRLRVAFIRIGGQP